MRWFFALWFNEMVSSISTLIRCSPYVDYLTVYISGAKLSYLIRHLQFTIDRFDELV